MLEEIGARFRVTIHATSTGDPNIDKTEKAIFGSLVASNGHSAQEIAVIGLTTRTTRNRLLKQLGA